MSFHPCHGFVRVGLTTPASQSPAPGLEPIIGREGYESQHAAGVQADPIWHHGANKNQDKLLSGEIRCTLTNRTPLLVANEQVPLSELTPELLRALQAKIHCEKPDKKKVLYPSLAPSGALLLPGESIKGMLAQVLGALTDSPLSNVNQRTFSYRPNVAEPAEAQAPNRIVQAAGLICQDTNGELKIWPVFSLENLAFIRGTMPQQWKDDFISTRIPIGRTQAIDDATRANANIHWYGVQNNQSSWFSLHYRFGLDRNFKFAKKFSHHPIEPHEIVMVRCDAVAGLLFDQDTHGNRTYRPSDFPLKVSAAILANYVDTQVHVHDRAVGHLADHPLWNKLKNDNTPLRRHPEPSKDQLIFCEILLPEDLANHSTDPGRLLHEFNERKGAGFQITSFGHNFRYRWRQLDSTTQVSIGFDSQSKTWKAAPRAEMKSGQSEQSLPPLTRLLGEFLESHPAGRVSINDALERDTPGGEGRFLTGSWKGSEQLKGLIALHPLTSRKPHFFPHHLNDADKAIGTQHGPLKLQSWGDGLVQQMGTDGRITWELSGLASNTQGRSFYLHPGADVQWEDGGRERFDLNSLIDSTQNAALQTKLRRLLSGEQSALARWVRKPGGEFGFCVRFKNLEPNELALLKAALDPSRNLVDPVPSAKKFEYLHKLGHGRPLGWGSVHLKIDETVLMDSNGKPLGADDPRCQTEATNTLIRTEAAAALKRLMLQRQKDNGTPAPYLLQRPEGEQQGTDLTKFANHVRKRHLEGSRRVP